MDEKLRKDCGLHGPRGRAVNRFFLTDMRWPREAVANLLPRVGEKLIRPYNYPVISSHSFTILREAPATYAAELASLALWFVLWQKKMGTHTSTLVSRSACVSPLFLNVRERRHADGLVWGRVSPGVESPPQ